MALSPAAHYANPISKIAKEENRSRETQDNTLPPPPVFKSIESAYEKTPCQEGHDNRWSDLCAQWKAADAAESSALWTLVGVGIGAFGLIGVGFTVYYAREAAKAAAASVDEARSTLIESRRASDAAVASVRAANIQIAETRTIAHKQLRPYLMVDSARIINLHVGGQVVALISFKNFGQTPAFIADRATNGALSNFPYEYEFNNLMETTGRPNAVVGPGGSVNRNWLCTRLINEVDIQAILHGQGAIWVWGIAEYTDIDGNRYETGYRFIFGGDAPLSNEGYMAVCFEGNYAT